MKKSGIILCLVLGLMASTAVHAWPIMDISAMKAGLKEKVAQAKAKVSTQALSAQVNKQITAVGEAGKTALDSGKAIVPERKTHTMGVPSLALEGDAVKNPIAAQAVLQQTTVMPTTAEEMMKKTTDEQRMIAERQKALTGELATQAAAKASLDKVDVAQVEAKGDSVEQGIMAAKTERETAQVYGQATLASSSAISSVADAAAANLALVSAKKLEEANIQSVATVNTEGEAK